MVGTKFIARHCFSKLPILTFLECPITWKWEQLSLVSLPGMDASRNFGFLTPCWAGPRRSGGACPSFLGACLCQMAVTHLPHDLSFPNGGHKKAQETQKRRAAARPVLNSLCFCGPTQRHERTSGCERKGLDKNWYSPLGPCLTNGAPRETFALLNFRGIHRPGSPPWRR